MSGTRTGGIKVAAIRCGVTVDDYRRAVEAGLKWCRGCADFVEREKFGGDRSRGDGLSSTCSSCREVERWKNRQKKGGES
jgi:hypothetical protein